MAFSRTLRTLLCTTRNTEALLLAFVSSFNALIADSSSLTAGEITSLDYYGDGTIGYDDRDYWLNWIIGRDWSPAITDRLPFSDATPTTEAESDPLGLRFDTDGVTERTHVVIIDADNTSGVYINESTNNTCWVDAARTVSAFPTLGSSANLFTPSTTGTTYNYKVWRDIRSLAETPGANSRRFPSITTPCTVYLRGGSYTLDREITLIKQSGVTNNPSLIDIRAYPGETVHIYMGNQFIDPSYDNTFMVTISRPDLHIDGNVIIHGFRLDGSGNRIFSAGVLAVTNAADRFRFTGTIRDFRAISPDHDDAGTLPQYVDFAFDNRTGLSAGESTGKMLSTIGVEIGQGNVGSTLENATFHPADDDIPPSVTVPGGSTGASYGETIDVAGATDLAIRRCTISGTSSHSAIRVRESGGITPSGLVIEYNDMRNPENSVLLLSNMDDSFVRYNRVHDFANRSDLAANDGYGITPADGHGNEITDNVVWLGATQGGETNYGIAVQVSQSDVTTEWTGNLISRNVIYGCGLFMGYSSGTPAVAPGRITLNVVEDNVIDGVSDYNATDPNADGPIVLNLGPHTADMYTNIIRDNILRQFDADTTVVVEKIPSSTFTDHPIADQSPWLLRNVSSDPEWTDADAGDFSIRNASPAYTMLAIGSIPLESTDLESEPYDCTLVPQYLPRMDVYSGRVVKNLSAFALLLAALLANSANGQTEYRTAHDGCDTRLWNVDGRVVFLVDGIVANLSNDHRPVEKFVGIGCEQRKRNDSGETSAVNQIRGFRGGNQRPCSVNSVPSPQDKFSSVSVKLRPAYCGAAGKVGVVHFPSNCSQRQFRLAVKSKTEPYIVSCLAVHGRNTSNLQFANIIANVTAHGRSTSHEQQNNSGEESHGINPLG